MKYSRLFITSVAALLAYAGSASAQPSFKLSSKFYVADFIRGKFWDGKHQFGNVFCLTFPRPTDAKSIAEAFFNNNTLYFSRAMYEDNTGLFVVTSVVPAGRSVEMEIGNLEAQNQKSVEAYPANFGQSRTTGLLGPSLVLTVRNSTEGPKDQPFPFIRSIANHPDGQLRTLSVHRLFVHGSDRIELAGLRYFNAPVNAEGEADAVASLTALVESAADSLQACTATLPARTP